MDFIDLIFKYLDKSKSSRIKHCSISLILGLVFPRTHLRVVPFVLKEDLGVPGCCSLRVEGRPGCSMVVCFPLRVVKRRPAAAGCT
ncbi:hypothetical protein Taro_001067 [Colocasia esculenta]|uniref:Uncharacterized protein n=1 Tax=Colocasia esculenta TaxID=4460 RepID=A0A843T9X0_COLES|nr:hypothetical protein [Colocasia esculenta]